MFRTSNPLLQESKFDRKAYLTGADPNAMMTVNGTINRTLALFAILQATPTFTRVVVLATLGIMGLYLINLGLRMFNVVAFPFLHEGTPLGIAFSLGVCVLAALNFILDFDLVERGANEGMPKYMEWYAGFGLLVTFVWLYLEMLRLLNKLRR